MLDIAVAYNRYRFLGNEFLTWIWYVIENDRATLERCDPELIDLVVGHRMVVENRLANGLETIIIKGDAAGLEEGILALNKGGEVTEIHLVHESGSLQWQFALKGENLSFSGLKLPETAAAESEEDIEGLVLEKLYLFEKPFQLIDGLYRHFVQTRLSEQWQQRTVPDMRKWMQSERKSV